MRKPAIVVKNSMIKDFNNLQKQWKVILVEGEKKTKAIHMFTDVSDCMEHLIAMGSVSKHLWAKIVNFYSKA